MVEVEAARRGAIATFIIDWPIIVFIGLVFGALAPERDPLRSRPFIAGAITALVFTATAVVSYFIVPDWMWMYFPADHGELRALVPWMPVGYVLTFVLAFAAALGLKSTLRRGAVWVAAATMLLFEIALVAVLWERYNLVGSREEWTAGRAAELFSLAPSGDARTIGLMGPVFGITFVICLVVAKRGAARVRA